MLVKLPTGDSATESDPAEGRNDYYEYESSYTATSSFDYSYESPSSSVSYDYYSNGRSLSDEDKQSVSPKTGILPTTNAEPQYDKKQTVVLKKENVTRE